MNYPPPPPGPPGGPPPGGYGPPPGGYGAPPGGYGPPPGGYGAPPGYGPGAPMPGMGMMQAHAPYGVDPMTGMPFSDKSKMVAGLLNIICAFFAIGGIGRFYTGHIGMGVAQLLVGWLTCGIWPIVDGIMMIMGKVPDAQGRPLRD